MIAMRVGGDSGRIPARSLRHGEAGLTSFRSERQRVEAVERVLFAAANTAQMLLRQEIPPSSE